MILVVKSPMLTSIEEDRGVEDRKSPWFRSALSANPVNSAEKQIIPMIKHVLGFTHIQPINGREK